jgi:hypothetical protein
MIDVLKLIWDAVQIGLVGTIVIVLLVQGVRYWVSDKRAGIFDQPR